QALGVRRYALAGARGHEAPAARQPPMTARIVTHADRHYDWLFAQHPELFWIPNPDGAPSAHGKVVFHTMWYHFRDGLKFAESPGPRIEHDFDAILGRSFDVPIGGGETVTMPTALIMAAVKEAFDVLANEHLAPEPSENPDPE